MQNEGRAAFKEQLLLGMMTTDSAGGSVCWSQSDLHSEFLIARTTQRDLVSDKACQSLFVSSGTSGLPHVA